MQSWMPLGHSIKIDGLGVFSLSLGFDTSTPSEKVFSQEQDDEDPKTKYRHICIKGINFKPDAKLIAALNKQADFERAEKDVVVPKKCSYTTGERIEKAQAIIANNGFMTLSDYARATGQCRSAASNDLKRLTALPDSPIATRGSGSHKVWIRRG